jgi:putative ABC transport system permease protein
VVVLADRTWRNRFGGAPDILGRTLTLNGRPYVVIGVTAPDYQSPFGPIDLWLPITAVPSPATFQRGVFNVWAVGRLKPGVTLDEGRQDLGLIASRLGSEFPASNAGFGVAALSLREQIAGPIRPALLTLLGAVALVLLIACANVANLQLARAAARRHELTLRMALGAGRSRLVRQLLTESLLLSLCGGAFGVLLAVFAVGALAASVPGGLPAFGPVGVSPAVLLFSAGITALAGVIFGVAPAWYLSQVNLHDMLKQRGSASADGTARFDIRNAFVAAELALCIILLVCATLLTRSLGRLQQIQPGFEPANLITFQFRLPTVKYAKPEQISAFLSQALEQVRQVHGVRDAALVSAAPFTGNWGTTNYVIEGRPAPDPGHEPPALTSLVSDGYFTTMRIPVLAGRDFDPRDRMGSLPVVIINQELARREWPGESPIGKRLRDASDSTWLTVAGVVGNAKQLTLGEEPRPQIYLPVLQQPRIFSNVMARTEGDPLALAPRIRAAIWTVDRDQPVWSIYSMDQLLSRSTARLRFTMMLTGAFATVALLLGALGVYGVMAFAVTQRTREVGIRIAIGARPSQVVGLVLARGLRVTAIATVLGLVASLGATRLLTSQLFGVAPSDPVTYGGVTLTLVAVALVACWLPARRAARTDPLIALRAE